MLDACAKKVKQTGIIWPSARASQLTAKCRKKHGHVRKTKAGANLRRWQREKWIDTKTKKPCGSVYTKTGKKIPHYCRPSHKVSKKTPKQYKKAIVKKMQYKKQHGLRAQL